jgi:hypothetical protein
MPSNKQVHIWFHLQVFAEQTRGSRFEKVLMMVYSKQNYWGFGLLLSSGVLGSRNTTFRELDLFPFSGEGEKTPIQLGPIERANLNHWKGSKWVGVFSAPFTWGRKQIQFPKRRVSIPKNTRRWKKFKPPVTLWSMRKFVLTYLSNIFTSNHIPCYLI